MSDRERVRDQLLRVGERGVRPSDFLGRTCDSGKPVLRLAARIGELRGEGMVIDTLEVRPQARYVLRSRVAPVPRGPLPQLTVEDTGQLRLDETKAGA